MMSRIAIQSNAALVLNWKQHPKYRNREKRRFNSKAPNNAKAKSDAFAEHPRYS